MNVKRIAILFCVLVAIGCTGKTGPMGPQGEQGPPGDDGLDGGGVVATYVWVWWVEDCTEWNAEGCSENPVPSNNVFQPTDYALQPGQFVRLTAYASTSIPILHGGSVEGLVELPFLVNQDGELASGAVAWTPGTGFTLANLKGFGVLVVIDVLSHS